MNDSKRIEVRRLAASAMMAYTGGLTAALWLSNDGPFVRSYIDPISLVVCASIAVVRAVG